MKDRVDKVIKVKNNYNIPITTFLLYQLSGVIDTLIPTKYSVFIAFLSRLRILHKQARFGRGSDATRFGQLE